MIKKSIKTILLAGVMVLTMGINVYAAELIVDSKLVNMRTSPNTNSRLVNTYTNGYVFTVIDGSEKVINGDKWVKVKDKNNVTGYVRMKYLISPKDKLIRDADIVTKQVLKNTEPESFSRDERLNISKNIESNVILLSGEGLHRVDISLKDLNRITCNGPISDAIYSKEKEIEVSRGGKNDLFVKISPIKITQGGFTEIRYNDFPRELYVECNNFVYNLSLLPKENLSSQTIAFKSPLDNKEKAINYEKSNEYETMVSDIFKLIYMEQIPEGYSVKKGVLKYEFSELDMRLRYVYTGHNYIAEDWEIKSNMDGIVELEENMFVSVLKNARAISLTVPRLSKNEKGRLLVIRANTSLN